MAQPSGGVSVDGRLFERVLESLCDARPASTADGAEALSRHEERQQALLELLNTRALEHSDQERLLSLSTAAKFFRVSELLYGRRRQFDRVLDCYCSDIARRNLVFAYVRQTLASRSVSVEEKRNVREAVLERLEDLIRIDAGETTRLVTASLGADLAEAVSRVVRCGKDDSTFAFLQCLFETADSVGSDAWQFEASVYERYVELLCQRSVSDAVVAFLRSHDGYRLTKALEICRRFRVAEASVVVLERSGDVSGAFEAAVQSLRVKLSVLVRSDSLLADGLKPVRATARDVVALLNRSSLRLDQPQLAQFWFSLFDLLLDNYNRLFGRKVGGDGSECGGLVDARDVYQSVLQHTVGCMVSHVPFTAVLEHVVAVGGGGEDGGGIGNVRQLLSGVVEACLYRRSVHATCWRIVRRDVNGALRALTRAARAPISPHLDAGACSACGRPTLKSSDEVICFQCGHAFHRPCLGGGEGLEDGAGGRRCCVICCRSRTRVTPAPFARSRVVVSRQSDADADSGTSSHGPPVYSDSLDQLRLSQRTPSRLEVLSELTQIEQTKTTRSSGTVWTGAATVLGRGSSALQGEKFSLRLAPPPVR